MPPCQMAVRHIQKKSTKRNNITDAVESVFPHADVQLCVVHHIRNVTKFVSWKDRKPLCSAMRPIYTAPTIEAAELALDHRRHDRLGTWIPLPISESKAVDGL